MSAYAICFGNTGSSFPNNRRIMCSLLRAVWPGLFAKGDAAQVSDEYARKIELRAGSPENSVTYGTGGDDGLGTAADGILEVALLNVNCKLPVSIDKGGRAADGIQSLVFSVWPFHADKLKDLVQICLILRYPPATAVGLVGNLLAQLGDVTRVVS